MGKKRQIDFQKTKLRVGKTLPKGKNVTDTSFKTRKIATSDQLKSVTGEVSLKDVLNYLAHNNVSVKKENLAKLTNYIIDNKDSLTLFFPDVLKRVGVMLMDSDHSIRMVVIDVLHTALRLLSDTQVSCFFTPLTSYMHCMLTHCDTAVRRDSLQLLDQVLATHPAVFCRASTLLHGLLNLISSATFGKGKKRRLNEHISSTLSSQQIRAEVLSHILSFLECLFVPLEEEDEDERETYWNVKKPLYLPLYMRGGTTPIPLEAMDDDLNHCPTDTQEFKDFVSDLLPLLFDIIKAEIPHNRALTRENTGVAGNLTDNLVDISVISNLNVVVQVLCYVGEWMLQQCPFDEIKDQEFKDLITKMVSQLFSYFPYQQLYDPQNQKKSETKNKASCLLLNLGVSYMYCMFVLESGTAFSDAEKMMSYLEVVYNVFSGMSEKAIDLLIKIIRICMSSPNVNDIYKNGLLFGLYGVLDSHKLSTCVKPLYNFFMDISLDYDYKDLLDSEAMRTWFNIINKEMLIMVESNTVNRRFFKYVRQICSRKYPFFIDLLNRSNPENFLDLLKYDNEDLHLTVTQMIACLDQPCTAVLDGLIDVICDPSFSIKSATRIIRQMHARFSGPEIPILQKLYFVKFLLNLGCDSLSLADPSSEIIIPDMLKSVMESCRFTIKPSAHWERHLKIMEVCYECLPCYLEKDILVLNILKFLNVILYQYTIIPVHSAIALLKLRKVAFEIEQNESLMGSFGELLFSSLMYISVMLSEESKGEALKPYALTELKNTLGLKVEDVHLIIHIIKLNIHSFGEAEMFNVLRLTQYLIHINLLTLENRKDYYAILENINSSWHRSNLLRPIWTNICKFFRLI